MNIITYLITWLTNMKLIHYVLTVIQTIQFLFMLSPDTGVISRPRLFTYVNFCKDFHYCLDFNAYSALLVRNISVNLMWTTVLIFLEWLMTLKNSWSRYNSFTDLHADLFSTCMLILQMEDYLLHIQTLSTLSIVIISHSLCHTCHLLNNFFSLVWINNESIY